MLEPTEVEGKRLWPAAGSGRSLSHRRVMVLGVLTAGLIALFIVPLVDLAAYAASTSLFSHILLVPFITGYLIYLQRQELRPQLNVESPDRVQALVPASAGVITLVSYWWLAARGVELSRNDSLFFLIFAFVWFLLAAAIVAAGWNLVRSIAFPALFLVFMAPLPDAMIHGLEVFFQHASADASAVLFNLTSTPVFREGLLFVLPGLIIEVAEECSGIRSSLVLFLTSLLGGYMLLRRTSSRLIFAASIVPIAIARNALRIFVISMLAVHVDPEIIHGPLHRRGGPIFFAVSLIPFVLLLLALRRFERRKEIDGATM
jgi:exosortase C (VPDSG-CTERM-specific)